MKFCVMMLSNFHLLQRPNVILDGPTNGLSIRQFHLRHLPLLVAEFAQPGAVKHDLLARAADLEPAGRAQRPSVEHDPQGGATT